MIPAKLVAPPGKPSRALSTLGDKARKSAKGRARRNKASVADQALDSGLSTAGYKNISLNIHENAIVLRFFAIPMLAQPL